MRSILKSLPSAIAAIVVLRVRGVQKALQWADHPIGAGTLTMKEMRDVRASVERAGRVLPGSTCLTKSLALARLLRKKGAAANVRIGVKTDPSFAAHAWVECDGKPVSGLRDDADLELSGHVAVNLHRDR
jgi:hypothetical protein